MLRSARRRDLDAIVALEAASFPPADRFARATWRRLIASASARVLLTADGLGACCWLLRRGSRVARLYSLAVHPDARGRGLGRALIVGSLPYIPRRCTALSLEVRVGNEGAIGLYRRLGFRIQEALPGYYSDGGHGVRMRVARTALGTG